MKILHITSTPVDYPGGMERVIWEISKRLAKKNKVTIIQTDLYSDTRHEKEEIKDNVRIITCRNNSFLFGYGYSTEFKRELKKIWKEYDIIHIHGCGRFTTDFSLKLIKRKKPIIFTSHGYFHSKKAAIFKILDNLILKLRLKNIRYANALTEAEFSDYKKLGIPKEKIVIIPNGVDLKKFKRNNREIEKLKEKFNLDKRIVLFVGRFSDNKGLDYLVQAVKGLNCKLLLVGKDAGYRREIEKLINKLGIEKRVIFTGSVSDEELIASYFASDVFCLPSKHEGFGLVVVEAMASGLPVVVSNKASLPFIVDNKRTGYVIEYGNVSELKEKIKKILDNKELKKELGKEGMKKAKKYSWDKIVKEYEKIYKKALGI